ncbi:hypothetical protein [Paenibacillus daejeonensis]|uniref:hypothetical protein n=1 Tax=Paenibacillus daejeonensis TaxID=135193 RepID=UPI0012F953B6|nr:hypothetical protein [Paenibacillus daejeonensis]
MMADVRPHCGTTAPLLARRYDDHIAGGIPSAWGEDYMTYMARLLTPLAWCVCDPYG